MQVWRSPPPYKTPAPLTLVRTFGHCAAATTCLAWSPDGAWVAGGSKDLTVRVWALAPPRGGYAPPTLAGHRAAPLALAFAGPAGPGATTLNPPALYTLSRDGALFAWCYEKGEENGAEAPSSSDSDTGRAPDAPDLPSSDAFTGGRWRLSAKHYFQQRGARLASAAFHPRAGLVAAGLTTGVFDLRTLPTFEPLHTLSIGTAPVTALAFNARGDWLIAGSAASGSLLAWEWRGEAYVLRATGHGAGAAAVAFSPDGGVIASGGGDARVRLFTAATGFCHASLAGHAAAVTGLAFLPATGALLSSSLDGSVKAWDLARYRCFRTLVPPERAQLTCVAADPGGDLAAAGTADSFAVIVWSVRSGRVLDALAAHEGPVSCLAFAPAAARAPLLASGSWDGTVRLWDVFGGGGALESLPHGSDVLALAWSPDGHTLAASTLDGAITLWNADAAVITGTIEGRRDLGPATGRGPAVAAALASAGAAFSTLAFSADGATLVAGGDSRHVCVYDVAERVLLARLDLSASRSLGGTLDARPRRRGVTDAGDADALPDADSDGDDGLLPPCAPGGGLLGGPASTARLPGTGAAGVAPAIRAAAVALDPTGRRLAVGTPEGVALFEDDAGAAFDPADLGLDVTPAACRAALAAGATVKAARLALRLNDRDLLREAILATRPGDVRAAARGVPPASAALVAAALADLLPATPHAELCLLWARALLRAHGRALREAPAGAAGPPLRALAAAASAMQADLGAAAGANVHTLKYLATAPGDEGEERESAEE